jgi:hypothetical protein
LYRRFRIAVQHTRNITRKLAVSRAVTFTLVWCGCAIGSHGCVLVEPALDTNFDASVGDSDTALADAANTDTTSIGSSGSSSPEPEPTSSNSVATLGTGAVDATTDSPDSVPSADGSIDATDRNGETVDARTSEVITNADGSSADSSSADSSTADAGPLKCVKLTSPVFSDFAELTLESAASGRSEWSFVNPQGFTGTLYVASSSLTSELWTDPTPALHIAGTVSDYAQFGLHFYPCVDASDFAGVVLDLSGTVGTAQLRVEVQLRSTTVQGQVPAATCLPANPDLWWQECAPPDHMFDIPDPASPLDLPWSSFDGGVPTLKPDPTEITGIELEFDWSNGATPYQVDLTVNGISFLAE